MTQPDPEELALLEERAAMLRARPETADDDRMFWGAAFSAGRDRYAVPLVSIRAALPLRFVTPVPMAPAGVVGIVLFQGRILTVLSMFALLDLASWHNDPTTLLVVEGANGRQFAVDCAETPRGLAIPQRDVDKTPVGPSGIREIALGGGEQISLIDLEQLLAHRKERGPRG